MVINYSTLMSMLTFTTNNCYVDYISKCFFKIELNKYINEIKYTHFFFLVFNVTIKNVYYIRSVFFR